MYDTSASPRLKSKIVTDGIGRNRSMSSNWKLASWLPRNPMMIVQFAGGKDYQVFTVAKQIGLPLLVLLVLLDSQKNRTVFSYVAVIKLRAVYGMQRPCVARDPTAKGWS